ncbi:Ig-like domain-containing protein [Duffyella gerundensis]|uniref:Ig-like domain-containing protein n=1 Tax=Duffyella gerundensis TaxID=1619313 RepID=UPI0021F76884|nr:Ig-like domain-containing protein [Duffyella gerundensis]
MKRNTFNRPTPQENQTNRFEQLAIAAPVISTIYESSRSPLMPVGDGVTSTDSTPVFEGTAAPYSLVSIWADGVKVGEGYANQFGIFNFEITTPLLAGPQLISARAELNNETSPSSAPQTVIFWNGEGTVDPVPPVEPPVEPPVDPLPPVEPPVDPLPPVEPPVEPTVPFIAPGVYNVVDNQGPRQGRLQYGASTDDASPTLYGHADRNALVYIFDNGQQIGSVQADRNGMWSYEPALNNGEHTLTFGGIDSTGAMRISPESFALTVAAPVAAAIIGALNDAGDNVGAQTDDSRPTLFGTGAPGGKVEIYNGYSRIGTADINADGTWSWTPAGALQDGNYSFRATVIGPDGTRLPQSPAFNLIIAKPVEYVAPTVSNVYDNVLAQKYLSNGSITDDTTPRFAGRGTPNSKIEIRDNDQKIAEVYVDHYGNWIWTSTQGLEPGNHRFSFVAIDEAGREFASNDFSLQIISHVNGRITSAEDNVGSVTDPLGNGARTDDATPTLKGVGTPGGKVDIYNGYSIIGRADINADGNWSWTPPAALQDGNYSFRATVISPDGTRLSQSPAFNLIIAKPVEYAAPTISSAYDNMLMQKYLSSGSITDDTTPRFTGRGTPNSKIEVRDNDQKIAEVYVDRYGNWSWMPTQTQALEPGNHRFNFVVTGEDGREFASNDFSLQIITHVAGRINFAEDNVGEITDPLTSGARTDDTTPTLKGVGTPGGKVDIYDSYGYHGTANINDNGEWSWTPSRGLLEGSYNFRAIVISPDGTRLAQSPTFNLVITKPVVYFAPVIENVLDNVGNVVSLSHGATTDDTTPTFSGRGVANSKITVYINEEAVGDIHVNAQGSWSYTPSPALEKGEYTFNFVTIDNKGVEHPSKGLTLQIEPPVPVRILFADDDIGANTDPLYDGSRTDDAQPTLHGTGTPNGFVIVINAQGLVGTATIRPDGTWSVTPENPLEIGRHALMALVTDPDGYTHPPTAPFDLIITEPNDFQAPNILYAIDSEGDQQLLPSGAISDDTTPTLRGEGQPGSTVVIRNLVTGEEAKVQVNGEGFWVWTPLASLSEREHFFTVAGIDENGKEHSLSDGSLFALQIVYPGDNRIISATDDVGSTESLLAGAQTDDTKPTLHGFGVPDGIVWIYDNDKLLGSETINGKGEWSFTPEQPLEMGIHHFSAKSSATTDKIMTPASPTFALEIVPVTGEPEPVEPEQLPPPVILAAYDNRDGERLIGEGEPSGDATPLLKGTATPFSTVGVFAAGYLFGRAEVDKDGNWELELTRTSGHVPLYAIAVDPENPQVRPSENSDVFNLHIQTDEPLLLDRRSLLQDADAPLFAEAEPVISATPPVEPTAFVPVSAPLLQTEEIAPTLY